MEMNTNNLMRESDKNRTIILDCGDEAFEIKMTDLIESLNQYGFTIVRFSEIN